MPRQPSGAGHKTRAKPSRLSSHRENRDQSLAARVGSDGRDDEGSPSALTTSSTIGGHDSPSSAPWNASSTITLVEEVSYLYGRAIHP